MGFERLQNFGSHETRPVFVPFLLPFLYVIFAWEKVMGILYPTQFAPPLLFPNRRHRVPILATRWSPNIGSIPIIAKMPWWPTFDVKIRSSNTERIHSTPVRRRRRRRRGSRPGIHNMFRIRNMCSPAITRTCVPPSLTIVGR